MNNNLYTNFMWVLEGSLWVILGISFLVGLAIETSKNARITGRFKFNYSILLRICLFLSGTIFLFFFNYRLAIATVCFFYFFYLQNRWKNWGK